MHPSVGLVFPKMAVFCQSVNVKGVGAGCEIVGDRYGLPAGVPNRTDLRRRRLLRSQRGPLPAPPGRQPPTTAATAARRIRPRRYVALTPVSPLF